MVNHPKAEAAHRLTGRLRAKVDHDDEPDDAKNGAKKTAGLGAAALFPFNNRPVLPQLLVKPIAHGIPVGAVLGVEVLPIFSAV